MAFCLLSVNSVLSFKKRIERRKISGQSKKNVKLNNSHALAGVCVVPPNHIWSQAWSYRDVLEPVLSSPAFKLCSHSSSLLHFLETHPHTRFKSYLLYQQSHLFLFTPPHLFASRMESAKDPKSNPISRADGKAPLKVKYISSPIHVSARDACEFKAVVQQLTGQKSEVPSPTCARMMVTNGTGKLHDHEGFTRTKPAALQPSGCDKFSSATALHEFGEDFCWRETSETLFNFQFPRQ